jgi:hypothetical protein
MIGFKIGFALLALSSVVLEIVTLMQRGVFNPANFFSFFTIQANIFAAVVLLVSALFMMKRKKSKRLDVVRGASTLYMVLTGVVFATLLSNLDPRILTAVPWDNTVLHYIMPIVLLIDWLLDRSATSPTGRVILVWLIYPAVYVAYTLLRGALVNWYPYPFLNPVNGGYGSIAVVSIFIAVFTGSAAVLLAKLTTLKLRKS